METNGPQQREQIEKSENGDHHPTQTPQINNENPTTPSPNNDVANESNNSSLDTNAAQQKLGNLTVFLLNKKCYKKDCSYEYESIENNYTNR